MVLAPRLECRGAREIAEQTGSRDDLPTHPSGLGYAASSRIEQWFASMGPPPRYDLARSGAPARSVSDLLAAASPEDLDEYLGMSLDYGPAVGADRLRHAIGGATSSDPFDVVVTHGAVEALLLACASSIGERRDIAVASPGYEGLLRAVEAAGGNALRVPVWEPGDARLHIAALCDLELTRYAAVVVNTPHNPTGLRADPDELDALALLCSESGTALIVDEVSLGTLDPEATTFAACSSDLPDAVVRVGDVSKAFGLGGLRVGWCIASAPKRFARIAQLRDITSLSNSTPGQLLAALALEHRRQLSTSPIARENLRGLDHWMTSIPLSGWVKPVDGLVAFCGLPLRCSSLQFTATLRAAFDVSVTPGGFFGHDSHLRLGLGLPVEDFTEGLGRLGEAISGAAP